MKKVMAVLLLMVSVSFGFGKYIEQSFIDDTLSLTFTSAVADTSVIMGMSEGHNVSPSRGLWNVMFWRVVPVVAGSTAVCTLYVDEVDYCPQTEDTVYTACPDSVVKSIAVTGVVGDSTWNKIAFQPDPCNGYRVRVKSGVGCSADSSFNLQTWFHIRRSLRTSR